MLPNLVVITLLENYAYFMNTLDKIGNQWEIFVYRLNLLETSFYNSDICQNEGAEWRILVPGCVDFLGRMWTARLLVFLSVFLSAWVGRGPPTHPLLGKGGKASQATHPASHPSGDPPQRPTLVLIAMWRVLVSVSSQYIFFCVRNPSGGSQIFFWGSQL